MSNKKKKVLVTGGSGFLGSHIADELSKRNFQVTIADIEDSKWKRNDQEIITGDIRDEGYLKEILHNQEIVYHLAALADLNKAKTKPTQSAEINVMGTVNLLQEAVRKDIKRFMFASTVYVYSRDGGFYKCSKQACENYIEEFNRVYNLDYTILRYGSLYGPRADEANGVYRLLKNAMFEGEIRHRGGPHDRREYIHVRDAAKLSVDALSDRHKNTHLVVTGNDTLKISDLFYMISEMLGKEIKHVFDEDGADDGHYRVTPYTFTPKVGKKLTTPEYVDMGQGLLQVIEEIYKKVDKKTD